jgi:hypothetical protein
LDVYAEPRGWDDAEVTAAQAYAGAIGGLLAAAAKAELTGALAEQLQTALQSRVLLEQAKAALRERERLDDQEAFTTCAEQPAREGAGCPRWLARWLPAGPCHAGEPSPRRPRPSSPTAALAHRNSTLSTQPEIVTWLVSGLSVKKSDGV